MIRGIYESSIGEEWWGDIFKGWFIDSCSPGETIFLKEVLQCPTP
jgi:hypothetical protein